MIAVLYATNIRGVWLDLRQPSDCWRGFVDRELVSRIQAGTLREFSRLGCDLEGGLLLWTSADPTRASVQSASPNSLDDGSSCPLCSVKHCRESRAGSQVQKFYCGQGLIPLALGRNLTAQSWESAVQNGQVPERRMIEHSVHPKRVRTYASAPENVR